MIDPSKVSSSDLARLYQRLDDSDSELGRTLVAIARAHLDDGDKLAAHRTLRRLVACDADFRTWAAASQVLESARDLNPEAASASLGVSLLATSTLDQLAPMIELAGVGAGLDLRVQVGPYGQLESEVLDPASQFHTYSPEVVVLAPDARELALPPSTGNVDEFVDASVRRWKALWSGLQGGTTTRVLQFNFVPPVERPLGNLEAAHAGSRWRIVADINRALAAAAGPNVHMVDVAGLAALYGLEHWSVDRYWFHGKQAVALGALPRLAREIAAVLQASIGRAKKCLVVDLDNTLWGGVVGDDGVENLQLEGSAVGEAHIALQNYLLELKARGILLAVCSKNDEQTAKAPFSERDDMRLALDDFVAFVANWEPKSDNLQLISRQLDIGLDALVFLDDNPAERAIVRQHLPEVDVIDLPHDASSYLRTLALYRGFETVVVTDEDVHRTDQYRARAAAAEVEAVAGSLEDYLDSLKMVAEVEPVTASTLPRVAQLIGKTNQWNLTTRRHDVRTLERFVNDDGYITRTLRLRDRFADHGLVAAVIAAPFDGGYDIDTFIMSCRVIGRTVERTLMDAVTFAAKTRGARSLRATYIPTPKNKVVADLYGRLGFQLNDDVDGTTTWQLRLDGALPSPNPHMRIEEGQ